MDIFLDTSAIRHLEFVQKAELIERMHVRKGWRFHITEMIRAELGGKPGGTIQSLLDRGIISVQRCPDNPPIHSDAFNLDPGEHEIVCIALQRWPAASSEYLILTDDRGAQRIIGERGMNTHDVLVFMGWCNMEGQLSKQDAREAFFRLKSARYHVEAGFEDDFLGGLV